MQITVMTTRLASSHTHRSAWVMCLCMLLGSFAFSQSAPSASQNQQSARAPLSHLYWHFLMHQNHLDAVAASRQQQGRDGKWLRDYYQKKLGFTDAQFASVRSAAQRLESELKEIDAKVKAVIDADHAVHPRRLASPSDLPPIPPQLLALRDQREVLIEHEASALKTALGPQQAAKLDAFLENEFAPNVRLQYVGPPRPHDPSRYPAEHPFPTEVQQ